ncbi:MAG TPA: Ig-like domain-containing protein [Candidatus Acidoferrales bacterium]|nr:Ig-like domain-containing protein [Candidatus Acidoferrales bacterium]
MFTTARRLGRLLVLGVSLALIISPILTYAATPSSGTVSETNTLVTWTGAFKTPTASSNCGSANNAACDNFQLNIVPPSAAFGPYVVDIRLQPALTGDWDLQVYGPDGSFITGSGNGPGGLERIVLSNPAAGTYTIAAAPFAPAIGAGAVSYTASAELQHQVIAPTAPGSEPLSYMNYAAPAPLGRTAGEPSIGCNWKTKRVMYQSILQTLRVEFDDCSSPARDTWLDKSAPTSVTGFDPILFTDSRTGRTVVSQLITPAVAQPLLVLTFGCSLSSFTDDDGDTWIPSEGCGPPSGADHQTVGGGRFADPLTRDPSGPVYPSAVYYCAQSGVTAYCSRSDDGGLTYGPGVPIYTTECSGLHGHVKVAPNDGTVYVPNKACTGSQGVIVSEDNGITWHVRPNLGSTSGDNDPSVAMADDGTVYLAYQDADGHPKVAVSTNKGQAWTNIRDVGAPFGIQNTAFPVVVAGDAQRAAFGFLGSTTAGSSQAATFPGEWHLYVSHTYDGGLTWTTVDTTPNDPVQRGCIWLQGGSNPCRNLLDFMDATIDQEGRMLVGWPDGCIGACAKSLPNSYTRIASIARQVNGRRLYAKFDVLAAPGAPLANATMDCVNPAVVHLSWFAPDSHGSPITAYKIYRRAEGGTFSLIATVDGSTLNYDDTLPNTTEKFFYQITAVNSVGESNACGEIEPAACVPPPPPPPPEDPCKFPGVTIFTDGTGDFTAPGENVAPGSEGWDMEKLSIDERSELGPGKIEFVLKVVNLQHVPPDTTWPIRFKVGTADFWVRMSDVIAPHNPTGAVKFAYGAGTAAGALPNNAGTPADPLSGFDAQGNIRIVVPRSAIGNPAIGSQLTAFLVRVSVEIGTGGGATPDNMPDSLSASGSYTIKGSENCVCNPPVANPDSATALQDNPVVIDVTGNDSDGGSPPLSVTGVTQPQHGTATNNGDGTVTYAPASGFNGADSFTYTVRNSCGQTATGNVSVTVNPSGPQCIEDDDSRIAYSPGWHLVNSSNASTGHFRLHNGADSTHFLRLDFNLVADNGTLDYYFATSTKGGAADVYVDGAFATTINYQGSSGAMRDPVFGAKQSFTIIGKGAHVFELRNLRGTVYVDKICTTDGSSSAAPTSGPGQTTSSTNSLALGQSLLQSLTVPSGTQVLSVVAEASTTVPYQLVVISPSGTVLGTVDSSNGIATANVAATAPGVYLIKLVNVGLGPVTIWSAATPTIGW